LHLLDDGDAGRFILSLAAGRQDT